MWASRFGSKSRAVAGPSSAVRSALLRGHAVSVTRSAVRTCERNGWPIQASQSPPELTILQLWSEWFGGVMPDMNDSVAALPMVAYLILASAWYEEMERL